jgi:ribosomal protein L37AE/L43A
MIEVTEVNTLHDLDPVIENLVKTGFVYLSYPTACPNCDNFVRLIGERKKNGSWFCPVCTAYWEYNKLEQQIPWEKAAWKVQTPSEIIIDRSPMSQFVPFGQNPTGFMQQFGGMTPRGAVSFDPTPIALAEEFPQNLETGFLTPSFGYRIKRKRRYLLAIAEDGTRTGRVKGGLSWGFDLVFKNRQKDEYDTLVAFWDLMGLWTPFQYTDPIKHTVHTCYFDSEVEAEASSFDALDFNVTITES